MRARKGVDRIPVHPIGVVRNSITSQNKKPSWTTESRIILANKYADGLKDLNKYSHIIVLYWLHQASREPAEMIVNPAGIQALPKVGLFGTRNTERRPNKIGLCVTKLLGVRSNVVKVIGLDAFNGSPVVDIKPFMRWDMPWETGIRRKTRGELMEFRFKGRIVVPEWWGFNSRRAPLRARLLS